MTAHGERRGNMIYHWKHGWIPLDHTAALSKAKGSHAGAAKIMQKHGIAHDASKVADQKHTSVASADHITLYHGTHAKHVESIRHDGLKQAMNGTAQSYTLTTSRKQAEGYAAGHGEHAAVVEFKVPRSEIRKIGVNNQAALWDKTVEHNVHGETAQAYALRRTLASRYITGVHRPSDGKADAHATRAAHLRAAADKKRAEADRIANGVGAPDRAGAMLRAKDSARMNARMDSGLRRYSEAQRQASALESKAHLADGRAKTAAEKQAASDLGATAAKLAPGDMIQHKGQAHMVTKVNKATVSVPSIVGGPWEDKLPISGISKHVKLADMKESTLRTLMSRAKGNAALQAVYTAELKRRGLPL